jgi:hypothetical protein
MRATDRNLVSLTWGLLFILWGVTSLFDFLPPGVGIIGTGAILLGLNAVRSLNHIPTRSGTNALGILALAWGGLELAQAYWRPPFEIPVFAILLIVMGSILMARVLRLERTSQYEP